MESTDLQTKITKKKPDRCRFLDLILPLTGSISYECFAVNIMNPRRFTAAFGSRTVMAADVLWFNAHIGFGVYLYRQTFIQTANTQWKIIYSVFGSALFNFGSVLFWGTSKALLPTVPERMKVLFGLGSGLLLLYIGWHWTDFLNNREFQQRNQR